MDNMIFTSEVCGVVLIAPFDKISRPPCSTIRFIVFLSLFFRCFSPFSFYHRTFSLTTASSNNKIPRINIFLFVIFILIFLTFYIFFQAAQLFNGRMKYLCDLVGQNKRWIVFASFYGIDRSYCHTNPVRKLLLRQSCGSSQILDNRFHAPHSSNRKLTS